MSRYLYLALLFACTPPASGADSPRLLYRIESVAGSTSMGDGGPAIAAQIGSIQGLATDRRGNLYLSDTDHQRVRKIDSKGIISTVAGNGTAGFSGDGEPAINAQLNLPYGLAVDQAGYLYIADKNNSRVRRVSPDGIISTYAGSGGQGSSGDGKLATLAQMLGPRNVAVDSAGNLYISEFGGHRVRKVTPDGLISTVTGNGVSGFRDGGGEAAAQLSFPAGLALDRQGDLYIADSGNQRVRKLVAGGQLTTVGLTSDYTLFTPMAVTVDLSGNLYVADATVTVAEFSNAQVWSRAAGTSSAGFSGDGKPALAAQLAEPLELATDLIGNLYIADKTRIRQVDIHGIMHTIAGDNYERAIGDGGSAQQAELSLPYAVTLDPWGNLYIADTGTQRIRRISSGTISTAAGHGTASPGGEASMATKTPLIDPMGVAVDLGGNLLFSENGAHRIRRVDSSGAISTVLGTGTAGVGPESMAATDTMLSAPRGLCTDRAGNLYVADTANHRVLKSPWVGLVITAAGNGAAGAGGDGGEARLAQLTKPSACTLDSAGNLYIADTYNHRIRKVDSSGTISTVAGAGTDNGSYGGDEGPAIAANLSAPRGVAVDDNGNIYISDTGNNRIRLVTPDHIIHTIAGTGAAGGSGDDGPALDAHLDTPGGILLDGSGDLYLADTNNNRIRRLVPNGIVKPPLVVPPPPITLVNAASLSPGAVSPGEVVTLFGSNLGPQAGAGAQLDSSGLLSNKLAGSEVRFDGVPAPLFYAQANQINAQVPYTVAGAALTHIEVFYLGQSAGTADAALVTAAPGIFPTLLNQDGTYNSATNPAARGTYLTLFATGEGLTNGANLSGQPAAAPYPQPTLPLVVTVNGMTAQIVWAGSAPGLVGLLQVNIRVPGGFVPSGAVPLALTAGNAISPDVIIWVQ